MENIQPLTQDIRMQIPDIRVPDNRSEDGRAVSEAEYWEKYYEHADFNYEWNNGILEEKPVSDYQNVLMYAWFVKLLEAYIEQRPLAKKVFTDFGFRLSFPGSTLIRKPDIGVVLNSNPEGLEKEDRTFSGIFDLCVEQISDQTLKDIKRDTVDKKKEYAASGVREYYILDAEDRHTAFYRRGKAGKYRHIPQDKNGVIRSNVLPGFQFRVSDLHSQPLLEDMAEDEVYRGFVLLRYQAAKKRAEQAEKLAESERQRAERLAAKLRALGISPDE